MKFVIRTRWVVLSSLVALAAISARAGSFSADFNSGTVPAGMTLLGGATNDVSGGPDGSGCLKLTAAAASQNGGFVLDDLDAGNRIETFTATFNMHMGNGTALPADGLSFNFGVAPSTATFGEQGIINGAGLNGISVGFDAYDNGTADDQEAPEVCVRFYPVGGSPQVVARRKLSNQLRTGAGYVPVMIRMNNAGTLDVFLNSVALFTNVFVEGTGTSGWRFSMCARTGGAYQEHWIDDLNITTVQQVNTRRYVKTAIPLAAPYLANTTNAVFRIPFQDGGFPIDTNATILYFNGVQVPISWYYATNGSGQLVTSQPIIYYDPKGLAPGSVNTAKLLLADNSGQPADTYYWTFTVTNAPLWSIKPGSRSWIPTTDSSSAPVVRSIAYSAVSNQLYVASRQGGTNIYVLNGNTGADLYSLNMTGVTGGDIGLVSIAVADDGAVYANNVITAGDTTGAVTIYKWATPDSNTPPTIAYNAIINPGIRWGDTLAARGSGVDTQLLMDDTGAAAGPWETAIFSTVDGTNFSSSIFFHNYTGNIIGHEISWGPTNTFYLKKKAPNANTPMPLQLMTAYNNAPGDINGYNTVVSSVSDFHYLIGPMAVDSSNNIAAGIFFASTTGDYDRLYLYDVSNPASPLQIATYYTNVTATTFGGSEQCYIFPVPHTANGNFIGQVVIGGGKIFAIDAANGIIAVSEGLPAPPVIAPPKMTAINSNGTITISWPATGAGEVLQENSTLAAGNWSNTGLTITTTNGINTVTITPNGANFYRLAK
jgi:hypothetical protein